MSRVTMSEVFGDAVAKQFQKAITDSSKAVNWDSLFATSENQTQETVKAAATRKKTTPIMPFVWQALGATVAFAALAVLGLWGANAIGMEHDMAFYPFLLALFGPSMALVSLGLMAEHIYKQKKNAKSYNADSVKLVLPQAVQYNARLETVKGTGESRIVISQTSSVVEGKKIVSKSRDIHSLTLGSGLAVDIAVAFDSVLKELEILTAQANEPMRQRLIQLGLATAVSQVEKLAELEDRAKRLRELDGLNQSVQAPINDYSEDWTSEIEAQQVILPESQRQATL